MKKAIISAVKVVFFLIFLLHFLVFLDEAVITRFFIKNTCQPSGLLIDLDYEDCTKYHGLSYHINKFFCELDPDMTYTSLSLHKGYHCISTPDFSHLYKDINAPLSDYLLAPTINILKYIYQKTIGVIYGAIINPLIGIIFGVWMLIRSKKTIDRGTRYVARTFSILLILGELFFGGITLLFWIIIIVSDIFALLSSLIS